jgi:hypothetical protein
MADESQVVTGTPPASGDTAPAVPSGETPTTTDAKAPDAAPNPAPAPEPKKVDPRQRKIAEMAYEVRELKRQNDRLLGLVERGNAPAQPGQPPRLEEFNSIDEFLDARDNYRDGLKVQKPTREAEPNQQRFVEAVKAATEDLRSTGTEKYEDFDEVVFDDSVKITPPMRDAILELEDLDVQTEVAYYLGKNPKEALRISKLSPIRQIAAIGKLEATLTAKPQPQKRPSAAPAPIEPVGGASTVFDPLAAAKSDKEWIQAREAELRKRRKG